MSLLQRVYVLSQDWAELEVCKVQEGFEDVTYIEKIVGEDVVIGGVDR